MNIALIPNYYNEKIIVACNELVTELVQNRHKVYVHKDIWDKIQNTISVNSHSELENEADVFIAMGGDGTIIHTAKHAGDKPILGVNMGRLGYLAGFEYGEYEEILSAINGYCEYDERMLIEIKSGENLIGYALNDGVVSAQLSKLLDFEVQIDKSTFNYRADGLIVSTPTGSTAYSLSAGGPVIDSSISCMLFTPICPHSLFNRSIVLSPITVLKLRVFPKYNEEVILTIDGGNPYFISPNEELSFTASNKKIKLIKGSQNNFFELVNKKLIISKN